MTVQELAVKYPFINRVRNPFFNRLPVENQIEVIEGTIATEALDYPEIKDNPAMAFWPLVMVGNQRRKPYTVKTKAGAVKVVANLENDIALNERTARGYNRLGGHFGERGNVVEQAKNNNLAREYFDRADHLREVQTYLKNKFSI